MWSAGRMDEALNYYNTCLTIRPQNPKVIFSMGMIYRSKQDYAKAVELFTQVSTQYGDSEYAEKARNQLTELAPYVQTAPQQPAEPEGEAQPEAGNRKQSRIIQTADRKQSRSSKIHKNEKRHYRRWKILLQCLFLR